MTGARRLPIKPITDETTAFAFVLGVLFNQRMRADDAWQAPHALGLRLGGLTPAHVLALPEDDFTDLFANPTAIHPFKKVMAARVYQTAELIEAIHNGDARRIWDRATARQFLERFQALPGIGRHKATVALFVITRELGVDIRADDRRYSINGCASLAQRFYPHHEPAARLTRPAVRPTQGGPVTTPTLLPDVHFDPDAQCYKTDDTLVVDDLIATMTMPLSATYQLTRDCNLRCAYCSEPPGIRTSSLDLHKEKIDKLAGMRRIATQLRRRGWAARRWRSASPRLRRSHLAG